MGWLETANRVHKKLLALKYPLNLNEQCFECKGRIKLMPCGICNHFYCLCCYESRIYKGFVVKICKKDLGEFYLRTNKGYSMPADKFKRNFY